MPVAREASESRAGPSQTVPMAGSWCCAWLKAMGSKQAHVCMEATGRHSLGVALALHDAGHVVSVVNPAQIRDFARTKLGRNKTDKVDAALIREYAELFKPGPWTPPSPAMRRLCELQTVRAGIVRNRAEWKNRIGSGLGDSTATKLAAATIEHFTAPTRGDRQGHRRDDRPGRRAARQTRPVAQRHRCRRDAGRLAAGGDAGARGSASEWRDGRLCGAQPEPPPVRLLD